VFLSSDSQGNIYVANYSGNSIAKFSEDGDLLLSFGVSGTGEGELTGPEGVAVDAQGLIYVAEYYYYHRVQVFSPTGVFLYSFGGETGTGNGQFYFNEPSLAFDTSGNLYIADGLNGRVQKFSLDSDTDWNVSVSGTASLSYLSVSNSNNTGAALSCTTGCVDGGGNTNWVFSLPAEDDEEDTRIYGSSSSSSQQSQTPAVPAPTPTVIPDTPACLPGHLFNIFTGARCASSPTAPPTLAVGAPTPGVGAATAPILFTKYLTLGITDPQVLALQKYLNAKGYLVALSGIGSAGNETSFFGALTKAAVIKYQKANNIDPIGVVGPLTRAALNAGK
jgi:hypothetical protein